MVRKSRGRQKLAMVRMERQSNLQVTFSKRRAGLFKKASELSTLCGAEVLVVVFSPGHKVYSFGHPSVEAIINRFFNGNPPENNNNALQIYQAHRNASINQLNMQLMQLMNEMEAEKNKNEMLKKMIMARRSENWWENPVEELDLNQLGEMKNALEQLKNNVALEADKVMMMQAGNQNPFYGASSSNQVQVDDAMFAYNSNPMSPPAVAAYPPQYNPVYRTGGGFY